MKALNIDRITTLDLLYQLIRRQRVPLEQFEPVVFRFNGVAVNHKQIEQFKSLFRCEQIPNSYLFVLAFRYLGFLLANSQIPSRLMGLIHVSTSYQQHQVHDWQISTDLEVGLTGFHSDEKGIQYHIEIKAFQQGVHTLSSQNVILDKSKRDKSSNEKNRQASSLVKMKEQPTVVEKNHLSQQLARRYAKISGDVNPIHLSKILAKLFGLKQAIMHGMYNVHWLFTRPEMKEALSGKMITFQFKRPCYLPTTVYLTELAEPNNTYGLFNHDNSTAYVIAIAATI